MYVLSSDLKLEMIRSAVGVDDEVGDQIRPCRLEQDMDALCRAGAALRVADDPAHRVAGGDGSGTDEALSGFERDVGDFAGRRVDLIEGAVGTRIDLDGVDVADAGRLHARCAISLVNAHMRIHRVVRCGLGGGNGLELAWQRQKLWHSTTCTGLGGSGCSTACRGVSS